MAILEPVGEWIHDMHLIPLRLVARTDRDDSYGAGYLRYRADLGWPHGVQEDDEMRWAWTATSARKADEARRPELSPVIGHTRRRR